MNEIELTIDGQTVRAAPGRTILEVARASGVDVPHLCHVPGLSSRAACRLCLVEVNGRQILAPSCSTQTAPGMDIKTDTPRINAIRRTVAEMVLAEHGECGRADCEVEAVAASVGVTDTRFSVKRSGGAIVASEYLAFVPAGCVHCDRCIAACSRGVLSRIGRGRDVSIALADGGASCVACGDCLAACPSGALCDPATLHRLEQRDAIQLPLPATAGRHREPEIRALHGKAHRKLTGVGSAAVRKVSSFNAAIAALADPEIFVATLPRKRFEDQEEIERFNRDGRPVYIVLGDPMREFKPRLSAHLAERGLTDARIREAFVDHLFQIASDHTQRRALKPRQFDVTVFTTKPEVTWREEWYVDNFDDTGTRLQLLTTVAGDLGPVLALPTDYDRRAFEKIRGERRATEKRRIDELEMLEYMSSENAIRELECRVQRARNVLELERMMAPTIGVSTPADVTLFIKGGDVPHSEAVTRNRRLVMTLVEFDQYMDTSARPHQGMK